MSGIVGIVNRNGAPVTSEEIAQMVAMINHRGPDGIKIWSHEAVGLGHAMMHTTPESSHEIMPIVDLRRGLSITADLRIDNRQELGDLLGFERNPGANAFKDSELVLRAYERWGENCAEKLIGDFAFAIWNHTRQELYCARDMAGSRPFYYYLDRRVFLFASELSSILQHSHAPRIINEEMVAEHLAVMIANNEETLWRHVLRLPPGHWLRVSLGRSEKRRYWKACAGTLHYRRRSDYAEHLAHLLHDAIRCRMRSCTPIAAHLSGGLDSSSVAVLAEKIRRQERRTDEEIRLLSMVYPGQACDESNYIHEVANFWSMKVHTFREHPFPKMDNYVAQAARYRDLPDYPTMAAGDIMRRDAQSHGIRVLLTGYGGDECFTWSAPSYSWLLRHMRPFALLRRLYSDITKQGIRHLSSKFYARVKQNNESIKQGNPFPWLSTDFVERTELTDRLKPMLPNQRFARRSQERLCATLQSGWWAHGREIEERATARFQIEGRDAFLDRRIVEFALSLPDSQLIDHGRKKVALRQAMNADLPPSVLERTDKATFDRAFFRAIVAAGGKSRLAHLHLAELGWVDADAAQAMYRTMAQHFHQGDEYLPHIFPLWMIFSTEAWLQGETDVASSA